MLAAGPLAAAEIAIEAPNVVTISPSLVTSGQPSAKALAKLKAQGFETVIYLAPPTVPDVVRTEPLVVAKQGLTFINIPINFKEPTDRDFENFAAILASQGERKVLVHCQVNMRASSMVFLYRVTRLKVAPDEAASAVTAVWVPQGSWKALIERQLRKHAIEFAGF